MPNPGDGRSQRTLTKAQYEKFAENCERLASSSATDAERKHYEVRASIFRRLADARLPSNKPEAHFIRRTVPGNWRINGHKQTGR